VTAAYTWFFASRNAGWSETRYRDSAFDEGSPVLNAVTLARMRLCASSVQLIAVRQAILNPGGRSDAKMLSLGDPNGIPGSWTDAAGKPDNPDSYRTAILNKLVAGTRKVNWLMLGVPDFAVDNTAVLAAVRPAYTERLNTYLSAVKAANLGIRYLGNVAGVGTIDRFYAQTEADPQIRFSFTGYQPTKGEEIIIRKCKPFNFLNGRRRVAGIEPGAGNVPDKIIIANTSKQRALGVPDSGDYTVQPYAYAVITGLTTEFQATARRVGKQVGTPRGRR